MKLMYIGSVIFLLSIFLDRADGDLARLSGKTSSFGHSYDLISDALSNAFFFVGLGVGLRAGDYGLLAIPMGIVAGFSVVGILALVIKLERLGGGRAGELAGFHGFDPDDIMILLPIMIWVGKGDVLLLLASTGAPLFFLFFCYFYRIKIKSLKL